MRRTGSRPRRPWSPVGGLLGLVAAVGVLLVVARLPWRRTPSLEQRLAPYLRDAAPSRLPGGVRRRRRRSVSVERLLRAGDGRRRAVGRAHRGGPGNGATPARPARVAEAVEQFRAEQVVWGALGAVLGAVARRWCCGAGRGVAVVPVVGCARRGRPRSGVLGARPAAVRAGRGAARSGCSPSSRPSPSCWRSPSAPARAPSARSSASRGPAAASCRAELGRTLADARAGASLVEALEGLADRTSLPSAGAVRRRRRRRGRAGHAAGRRPARAGPGRPRGRRAARLLEAGGRKEIAMMVPVVFLVLPVTVLFAVYPGLTVLDLTL